jgi:hypothetical protein
MLSWSVFWHGDHTKQCHCHLQQNETSASMPAGQPSSRGSSFNNNSSECGAQHTSELHQTQHELAAARAKLLAVRAEAQRLQVQLMQPD